MYKSAGILLERAGTYGALQTMFVLVSLLVCLIPTTSVACFPQSGSPEWTALFNTTYRWIS